MMGIYQIKNINNEKIYIGSSKNIAKRRSEHIEALHYNAHTNYKLQYDFNKYGIHNFSFTILEFVKNVKLLLDREQEWLDGMNIDKNYNISSYSKQEYSDRMKDNYSDILNFNLKLEDIKLLNKNLKILDNTRMNSIGKKWNNLSREWFNSTDSKTFKQLANNMRNYMEHYCKQSGGNIYWTSYISYQKKLATNGIIKSFISFTDIPIDKRNNLGFFMNLFPNIAASNILKIDRDKYAIKLLLKWITNVSNIKKPINLYLPSSRMRRLLVEYLEQYKK